MTNRNKLLELLLMGTPRTHTIKLDASSLSGLSEAEMQTAMVIGEETERERESRRPADGTLLKGLLQSEIDYVDTLYWDDILLSPAVVRKCTSRLNVTASDLLEVAIDKCHPKNWKALFWMREWFTQIHRDASEDIAEALEEFEKIAEKKRKAAAHRQVEAATNARRRIGQEGIARIAELAEPLRSKKSKEDAAHLIGKAIGKSSATVRKKLSKMYPGKSWKDL